MPYTRSPSRAHRLTHSPKPPPTRCTPTLTPSSSSSSAQPWPNATPPGATFPAPDYALLPPPDIKPPTSTEAPWPANITSYAVQVTTAEKTVFSAYHTAEILGEYRDGEPSDVTGDTYFRIASNTKVFTVLAVLLTEGMSLDDGVLKYIPELADGEGGVEWGDVTLGALGGHLAGIASCSSLSLERHTGMPFEKIVQEKILTPLNLTSTFQKPHDSSGAIPYQRNDWRWNEGIKNAAGGLYASSTDLSKFPRSLLNHGAGLGGVGMTRGRMNGWLKGGSSTGSPWSGYGTPWEVVYSNTLAPDGHVVPVVTKGGSLAGYPSTTIILPDYALAANVLVSGAAAANRYLRDAIISQLIPWARSHAFSQTTTKFTGTYYQGCVGMLTPGEVELRLLPTGIGSVWRMSINFTPHEENEETVWSRACFTNMDTWAYAGQSVSEFVFLSEGEEEVSVAVGVELPAFRISLVKLEDVGKKEVNDEFK
ncbi:beta-lactamase/transpeptidase-like protein [Tuber magnatum]|uniref:Beta-lactamase/transpeptidase-like protein n=1 Tax=Tuber magnatum TaxID=42249 RepID=A0A317SZ89_9PEZI|nr:beta-lactamase/transpeptidase-like protein [Tuber magnatum]